MRVIEGPLNPEFLDILENFTGWFFQQDRGQIRLDGKPDENEYYTSQEYLATVRKPEHVGFPEVTYGGDMAKPVYTPDFYRPKIVELDNALTAFFGARYCAVKMYYPQNGYMGWHTNWNAHGYNILLSYNHTGEGFFRYIDPLTQEIVTLQDKKGWNCKVGYFGTKDQTDKVYWHCARTYGERITIGYVVPDEDMWQMMVDDLNA